MADHAYTPDKEGYEQSLADLEEIEPANKPSYSKFIVVLMFVTIIAFVVTCLVFYWHGKTVDPVLIGFFFGCFGFEFGSLAFIRGRKLKYTGGDPGNKKMPHVETEDDDDE